MVRVLFVCTGNICRSPTAEGVFRHLVGEAGLSHAIETASAGTHAYHVGNGADPRSTAAAWRRGIDLSSHVARRFDSRDLDEFDYVLAMDRDNMRHIETMLGRRAAGEAPRAKIGFALDYAPALWSMREVPDPYMGAEGFERVLDIIETACDGLLEHIRKNDLAPGRG